MSHKNNITPYLSSEGILIVKCKTCNLTTIQTNDCNYCHECYLVRKREYYNTYNKSENQKTKRTEYARKYRAIPENREKHVSSVGKYNKTLNGKARRIQYEKTDKFKRWNSEYVKNKIKTDFDYRFRKNISNRIRMALKENRKSNKTKELVGLSIKDLKMYLASKFKDGMSWDNYGLKGWHIDHIKPCSAFDLTDVEQQKECFHYTNLQPLWAIDNLKKSDKYEGYSL